MAGSIRKRGKTWYYSFELGKVAGKRKRIEKGGFITKKEAETALIKALSAFESGEILNHDNISFADFLDLYYRDYVCIHNKHNTQLSFLSTSNKLKQQLGKYKLINITPALCQDFINKLYNEGKKQGTIKLQLTILRMVFNYAIHPLNILKNNPAQKLKIPKFDYDRKVKTISIDEFNTLINAVKLSLVKYKIALLIGFHTGMRETEITGLTWDKINFEDNTILVDQKLISRSGEKIFETPKSRSSVRTIKIGKTLIDILKAEKERQKQLKEEYLEHYYKESDLSVVMI